MGESEKRTAPPPPPLSGTFVRIPPKKESRKPWGSDYDNYEDYYYEEDEVQ